jgi:hypothetical protein
LTVAVVPLAAILAVGAVVEAEVVDKELIGAASVLAGEDAGFLSLAEVSLIAEMVSMTDGVMSSSDALAMGTVVEAEVGVEEVFEVASLLADVVETGVAMTEGVTMAEEVVPFEVTPELTDVVEAGIASMALLTEDFDLVIITISEMKLKCMKPIYSFFFMSAILTSGECK